MDSGTGDLTFCTHATPRLTLGWPGLYISPTPETNRPNDQETNVASAAVCSLIERVYVRRRSLEPLRCLPASLPRFASPCWSNPHTLGLMGLGRTARGHGNRVHSRDSPNKEPSGPCFAGTVVRCSNPEATTNSAPRAGIAACPANSARATAKHHVWAKRNRNCPLATTERGPALARRRDLAGLHSKGR